MFHGVIIGGLFVAKALYPHMLLPWTRDILLSVTVPALMFILWDQAVAGTWWHYNKKYILGIYGGSLPIEEVLFFFTVPYACLALWLNMNAFISVGMMPLEVWIWIAMGLYVLGSVMTLRYWRRKKWYTASVCATMSGLLFLDAIMGTLLFTRGMFWLFIGAVVVLTGIFDGYLTARPVVTYNKKIKTGLRIGTIPIEDFFYGIALVCSVVVLYVSIV